MKRSIKIALLAAVAVFAVSAINPPRAQADSEDIIIWSSVGAGVAIAVVLIATLFTRDESQIFLTERATPLDTGTAAESSIHFGTDCRRPDGTVALACW